MEVKVLAQIRLPFRTTEGIFPWQLALVLADWEGMECVPGLELNLTLYHRIHEPSVTNEPASEAQSPLSPRALLFEMLR